LINHIDGMRRLSSKNGLLISLKCHYKNTQKALEKNYTVFDTTPTTFILTPTLDNIDYQLFIARFNEIVIKDPKTHEKVPLKHCEQNIWVAKPTCMNQGKGIKLLRTLKEIM
jgi:hypothetical protein